MENKKLYVVKTKDGGVFTSYCENNIEAKEKFPNEQVKEVTFSKFYDHLRERKLYLSDITNSTRQQGWFDPCYIFVSDTDLIQECRMMLWLFINVMDNFSMLNLREPERKVLLIGINQDLYSELKKHESWVLANFIEDDYKQFYDYL
jgi:hypothetical protein